MFTGRRRLSFQAASGTSICVYLSVTTDQIQALTTTRDMNSISPFGLSSDTSKVDPPLRLCTVCVWLKEAWTRCAWQKLRKHWVAHSLKVLKMFKIRHRGGCKLAHEPGTLPRHSLPQKWGMETETHTFSKKKEGGYFSFPNNEISSWCVT